MKLEQIYKKVIEKGIEADIRKKAEIKKSLCRQKDNFNQLSAKEKEYFDQEAFFNPFSDTRIIYGNRQETIKSIMVGVDIGVSELLLAQRLNDKGGEINLVVSHHPQGKALAQFYQVMDLQVDGLVDCGLSVSFSENTLLQRKEEVSRRVHSANFNRTYCAAKLLGLNFFCMHTPCDNLAYQFLRKKIDSIKPCCLQELMEILFSIEEYKEAAQFSNAPKMVIGSKQSRCKKIHLEFTGGTEGSKDIYGQLAAKGIDTIVAMHQSEAHYQKCKEANINVIFASHIASDNLGINLMLDHLQAEKNFKKIYEVSGFKRVKRKKITN